VNPETTLHVAIPHPWQNLVSRSDVDNSGDVTANDALRIINELRNRIYSSRSTSQVADPLSLPNWPSTYFDVSGDDKITSIDALRVINILAINGNASEPEGESLDAVFTRWPKRVESRINEEAFDDSAWEFADLENAPAANHQLIKPMAFPSALHLDAFERTPSEEMPQSTVTRLENQANQLDHRVKTLGQKPTGQP
jgi:hypothetical protein